MTRGVDLKTMAYMRSAGALYLLDTCTIGVYTDGTADETGKPTQVWTYGSTLTCSFKEATAAEIEAWGQVDKLDGTVFLPLGTAINRKDRIHLLTKWGTPYDVYFDVLGDAVAGPIQLQVRVSCVTVTSKV